MPDLGRAHNYILVFLQIPFKHLLKECCSLSMSDHLIPDIDYFIFIVYAVILFVVLKTFLFRKVELKLVLGTFTLKLFAILLINFLLINVWKTGDAIAYYGEAKKLIALIEDDVTNIKYFFSSVEAYNEKIQFDNTLIQSNAGSGNEANFFVVKFCAFFYPLSLGKFIIINLWFGFLSTIAQLKLYQILSNRYPYMKKGIALSILLMPTLALYASPIFKETLCLSFLALGIHSAFQISKKVKIGRNFLSLMLSIACIYWVKSYVLVAFLLSLFFTYFFKVMRYYYKISLLSKLFVFIFILGLLAFFILNLSFFDPYVVSFVDTSNLFQQHYLNKEDGSSFEIGKIETSFAGLLSKAPLALFTTYFRPLIWEIRKPIVLFSALECLFILIVAISAFLKNGKYLHRILKNDLFVNILFIYVIILGAVIGLTTFNFGTLIRYKVPAVPFMWFFIFLLWNYKPQESIPFKDANEKSSHSN